MEIWDCVMPHRFLINRSLRRESERLRTQINAYQAEYDRRITECREELEQAKLEKQKSLESVKESMLKELRSEQEGFAAAKQDMITYADIYLQRNCLRQMKELQVKRLELVRENTDFVREQASLIEEEIALLEERKREFTALTRVDDIIELAGDSGCEFGFEQGDDAKCLLDKISRAIAERSGGQGPERYALTRLRRIIQERSEYLATISYIEWVIRQKKQFGRQLSEKRKRLKSEKDRILSEIKRINKEIRDAGEQLENIARKIRFFWGQPIAYLTADIDYAYKERKETGQRLKEVGGELHERAERHDDDQGAWERLQSERTELSSKMESLTTDIDTMKEKRRRLSQEWKDLISLCEKQEVRLIQKKKYVDECQIIDGRLAELEKIRADGAAEAQEIYERECRELDAEHKRLRGEAEKEKSVKKSRLEQLETRCRQMAAGIKDAERKVKEIEDKDDRSFFMKIISDPPGLQETKIYLSQAGKSYQDLQTRRTVAVKDVEESEKKLADLDERYERERRELAPRYLRPTEEEIREEKALLWRKRNIAEQRKEGGHENKN